MIQQGTVKTEIANNIARVVFFHPQSNSLPGSLLRKLAEEITDAGANSRVKVIILQSEGEKAFCGGASFDELISIKNHEDGKKFFSGFADVINAMRKAPKFILARVQGKTVGGGVGLAAAADYTLAVESASIRLSELALGIGPFVVGPAVERKMGTAAFTTLTINPTAWKDAHWARDQGLYSDILTDVHTLDAAVNNLAQQLSQSNSEAMSELKKVMWANTDHWNTLLVERAEISGRLVLSDFTKNAIERLKSSAKLK